MFRSGSKSLANKKPKIDETILHNLFSTLSDSDNPDMIYMDGIAAICDTIKLDPSDVRALVLCWKLAGNASTTPGCITREQFVKGMISLDAASLESISTPALDPGFLEKSQFREFYKFAFQFSREGSKKTIGKLSKIIMFNVFEFKFLSR